MTVKEAPAEETPGNAAMCAMFAARKRVFVDILQWELPVLEDRYELDQFDTAAAEYIILLGTDGKHRASARLLPSGGPHLLADLYPHLCEAGIPRGEAIREISRFCIDPDQSREERRNARDELVTALADYALTHGITDYTGIAEVAWFEKIMAFGWTCEALGEAMEDGPTAIRALRIRIDGETIAGLRRTGTYVPLARADYENGETLQ